MSRNNPINQNNQIGTNSIPKGDKNYPLFNSLAQKNTNKIVIEVKDKAEVIEEQRRKKEESNESPVKVNHDYSVK
ncbi:MAG: hypothetical protein MJ252_27895 [archaeon]|nr:hypothetical protein [archaeon]